MDVVKLNDVLYLDFVTHNPSTGAVSDADATPTCEVFENDNDTAILTPTCTKRAGKTGNYRVQVSVTAENGFEINKSYNVVVSAAVNSVASKKVIKSFLVDIITRQLASVVDDVENSSLTFKTDLTESVDNAHKDKLLIFISGSDVREVKKVTAYNGTTKFITVQDGFTVEPAAADLFVLLNF